MTSIIYPILDRLGRHGLNVHGVAPPFAEARRLLPGCRSVVVVGSGGRALWDDFEGALVDQPHRLRLEDDPLEAHVQRLVEGADPPEIAAVEGRVWHYAADPQVPMQELAIAAGLGARGRLWLVMHPVYGPWLALRAVCLTTEELPRSPQVAQSPCAGCPAPCAPACPANALQKGDLDWKRCIAHQAFRGRCFPICHSRRACPEGAEHAYTDLQQRYHAQPHTGRAALAAHLGIDEPGEAPPGLFTRVLRDYLKKNKES